MSQIGRVQWSRLGITVYDATGGFVCRIEHAEDRHFFNEIIVAALKRISDEQIKRKAFVSDGAETAEVVGAAV